jgi:hypothetical protein
MSSTATSNGHKTLDQPIITSRAEIRRQVQEEVRQALAGRRSPRLDLAIRIFACLWLVAALALSFLR